MRIFWVYSRFKVHVGQNVLALSNLKYMSFPLSVTTVKSFHVGHNPLALHAGHPPLAWDMGWCVCVCVSTCWPIMWPLKEKGCFWCMLANTLALATSCVCGHVAHMLGFFCRVSNPKGSSWWPTSWPGIPEMFCDSIVSWPEGSRDLDQRSKLCEKL